VNKILFIDCETGGLDPTKHSILSLGAVVWADGFVVDEIEIKITEPTIVAEEQALKVNGINIKEHELAGVNPVAAVQALENFLLNNDMRGQVELGGHNVQFDVAFLQRLYRLANAKYHFSHRVVCTQGLAVALRYAGLLNLKGVSGDLVFGYYKVAPTRENGTHEALGDARASALAFTKMIQTIRKEAYGPQPERSETSS